MEDEEVAMVDGVFEGAFGALGDKTWFEMEALVDAMEVVGDRVLAREASSSSSSSPWQWVRIFPMDPIDDIINAIVKMRIMFHDVSKKTSQEHAIRKIGIWSSPSIFNSFDKEIRTASSEQSLNAVGLVIELIRDSALVNATVFDGFIELSKDGRKTRRRISFVLEGELVLSVEGELDFFSRRRISTCLWKAN
ncbi:hypothetical protein Tco_0079775 [Tanacetum coccineum]